MNTVLVELDVPARADVSRRTAGNAPLRSWLLGSTFIFDAFLVVAALIFWAVAELDQEAMLTLGILAALALAVSLWLGVRYWADVRYQGFLVLQAGFVYWYFLPMLLTALRGQVYLEREPRYFSASEVAEGYVAILLTKFISSLIYQLSRKGITTKIRRAVEWASNRSYSIPVSVAAIHLILGLLPFFLAGRSPIVAMLGSRSRDGIFPSSNLGSADSLLFLCTFFLMSACLIGFAVFVLNRAGFKRWMMLSIALFALAIIAVGLSTRTTMMAVSVPALCIYLLRRPNRSRITKVLICLVAMWIAADLVVSFRLGGLRYSLLAGRSSFTAGANLIDNDFYGELLYVMEVVPGLVPFSYESPIAFAASTLIPRAIWPDKPVDKNGERVMRIRLKNEGGVLGGSLLPGIIGQYWEVSGWLGVVVAGIWLGFAFAMLDGFLTSSSWPVRYLVFTVSWGAFISFRTFALSNLLPAFVCIGTFLIFSRSNHLAKLRRYSRRMP
jgi:oligosaccharide repeat unit polymerase